MNTRALKLVFLAVLAGAFVTSASAGTVSWTSWTAQPTSTEATGTMTFGAQTITVTYNGEINFTQLNGTGYNYYLPLSTYTSTTVSNAPVSDMISINGNDSVHTITFSSPVTDPVMALVSMGQGGVPTTYNFNGSFTILSQGPGNAYGGCNTCLTESGNSLIGTEGDGVIQFNGTFSSITWTGDHPEYWNGFTVGAVSPAASTPEPSTLLLLGAGLAGLVGAIRRKR